MRPHKLLMKAFGPFAKETTVDFDAMGNSIYLISGDTGAGKTTIFDGLIYALYGTASGGARSGLGTEAFHSDYAKEGSRRDEMRVELTFSNADRRYAIVRRMYWGKKGEAKAPVKESLLTEDGSTIVHSRGREDRDEVTAKVTEILGLDADQFRRIIMLAQGEFQKFLTAKSDERGIILGKLFNNRQHQDFQYRLKAAAVLLREQENAALEEAKAQLKTFVFPDLPGDASFSSAAVPEAWHPVSEEDRSAITVDHPELIPVLQKMLEEINAGLTEVRKSIREEEASLRKLEALRIQGETCNVLLDDLESRKKQRSGLETKRSEMDALRSLLKLAEAAEKVLPLENAKQLAEESWESILKRIRQLEQMKEQLADEAAFRQKHCMEVQARNNPLIAERKNRISAVRTILHFYDDLERSTAERAQRSEALKAAAEETDRAAAALHELRRRQTELSEEIRRLAGAGEYALASSKSELEKLVRHKAELEEITESTAIVQRLIAEEADLAGALVNARKEELAAEEKHLRMNRAFIEGQAGILAHELREKLKTEKEVSCPVCGSRHSAADVSLFASLKEEIPVREQVDQAYAAWESARRSAGTAREKHDRKANELSVKRTALLEKAGRRLGLTEEERALFAAGRDGKSPERGELSQIPDNELWERLQEGSALTKALHACQAEIAKAQEHFDRASAEKAAKEKASLEKAQADEQVLKAQEALEHARQKYSDAKRAAAVADTQVENWRQQLEGYPESKAAAEKIIDTLDKETGSLQQQVDDAGEELQQCLRKQERNSGELSSAYAEKENRERVREAAAKSFQSQLKKCAFAEAEAYHAALSPEGERLSQEKLAAWILGKRAEIEGYDEECRSLDAAVRQLERSTKGMIRADLPAIREQIAKAAEQLEERKAIEKEISARQRTDQLAYRELCEIEERRLRYRKVSMKLGPLADTADGKYAFSRYVLGSFFHSIVEQANVHLETMTDGEYLLVPKESGDGRSNLGLELRVLNTITGRERETASLSGGQLFEASLALALGLSDVVQMESSSRIQIDSMFIDEGFGSLDEGRLDKAIEVLQHLSAGKRQIGIISHVARLDECIPKKIHVIAGERGSGVSIETDECRRPHVGKKPV